MPKLKNPTRKQAEDILDRTFSKYIRLRDCLKTTNTPDMGRCCTCNNLFAFAHLQAGHFLSRRYKAIKYNEKNVHAQCNRCNKYLYGNPVEYLAFMLETYGHQVIADLTAQRHALTHDKADHYIGLNAIFKKKLTKLEKT